MITNNNLTTISSYNSQYPLTHYEIGQLYTFFIHNCNIPNLTKSDIETIEKFSSVLNSIPSTNTEQYLNFTRITGIIIDKHQSTNNHDHDTITVMFQISPDNYVLNKYVVNYKNVFTNQLNTTSI